MKIAIHVRRTRSHTNAVIKAFVDAISISARVAGKPEKFPGTGSPSIWCCPKLKLRFDSEYNSFDNFAASLSSPVSVE